MMESKKLLIHIIHPPLSFKKNIMEVIWVLAVASAPESHNIKIIFSGDGIYFTLKKFDMLDWTRVLTSLNVLSVELFVEEESLAEKGIKSTDIREEFIVRSRKELASFPSWSDHAIVL